MHLCEVRRLANYANLFNNLENCKRVTQRAVYRTVMRNLAEQKNFPERRSAAVKKDENRIVIYLDEDTFGIVKHRAENRGKSPNLYAKELLVDAIRRGNEDVMHALNYLAEQVGAVKDEAEKTRRMTVENFELVFTDLDELKAKAAATETQAKKKGAS
jgi:hypothetical protein